MEPDYSNIDFIVDSRGDIYKNFFEFEKKIIYINPTGEASFKLENIKNLEREI